jgi:hypothetical protein
MELSTTREPVVMQPLRNSPAFYETHRFITAFTIAIHWSLSLAQTNPVNTVLSYVSKIHLSIINPPSLSFPSGLVPSSFLTNNLYALLFFLIRATCHAHFILLALIIIIKKVILHSWSKMGFLYTFPVIHVK